MVAAFAALALVLAMVGVFGVLAYAVQQRQRDRCAHGARGDQRPRDVDRVRDAGAMVATGAITGVALAALSGSLNLDVPVRRRSARSADVPDRARPHQAARRSSRPRRRPGAPAASIPSSPSARNTEAVASWWVGVDSDRGEAPNPFAPVAAIGRTLPDVEGRPRGASRRSRSTARCSCASRRTSRPSRIPSS